MKSRFLFSLQKAINHFLSLDPQSKENWERFENKSILIELKGLPFMFQLLFLKDKTVALKTEDFIFSDTVIKGGPFSLLHLTFAKDNRRSLLADSVEMEGDLELGQAVIDMFDELHIDWEEWLSSFIGDIPSSYIGRFVTQSKRIAKEIQTSLSEQIDEYIHEEICLFPFALELADFFNDVDILRMDVDRLEARVDRIMLRLRG